MTFESQKKVERFLKRKRFTFAHISDADDYIKYIGTSPHPESIFIDKYGDIKYVESVISEYDADLFEAIIEELIGVD